MPPWSIAGGYRLRPGKFIACPLKPNGNMLAVPVPRQLTLLVITPRSWESSLGTWIILAGNLNPLVRKSLMLGASMTCTAILPNGAWITTTRLSIALLKQAFPLSPRSCYRRKRNILTWYEGAPGMMRHRFYAAPPAGHP